MHQYAPICTNIEQEDMRNKHRAELGINGTDPNTNYRWIGCNNVAGYNNAAQSKGNESEIFGGENMVMIGVVRH